MKESPNEAVWQWLQGNPDEELCATAITAAEIHDGIEQMPVGRRRRQVREAADVAFAVVEGDLLSFTAEAAMAYSVVVRDRRRAGCRSGSWMRRSRRSVWWSRLRSRPGIPRTSPGPGRADQSVGVRPYRAVDAESRDGARAIRLRR